MEVCMNLIFYDKTERIRQLSYEVHHYFGFGFLEKVYENALKHVLENEGFFVEQQKPINVRYKDNYLVGEYFADLVVNNEILIELKAVKMLQNIHQAQLLHYLKATGIKVGLLINFGTGKLGFKRFVF